jgi:toxin CcdB
VPLPPEAPAPAPAARLNPPVDIAGVRHLVVTQYAAATHVRELGERAAKLASYYDTTVAALDLLIIGAWAAPGSHVTRIMVTN